MTNLAELGPHNWQDFSDYWREADAEWLQARSILRVDTFANLPTVVPTPGTGQIVYVKDIAGFQKDVLFLYASDSKGDKTNIPGWKPYPALPRYLYAAEDSNLRVTFGHHTGDPSKSVPAVSLSPTGLAVVSDFVARGTGGSADVLKVTKDNISITTPGTNFKTVVLTTDLAGLVSNLPITAPGFISTGGAVTMNGVVTMGDVTATKLTSSSAVSSVTLTVSGAASALQYTASGATTAGGLKAGGGQFYGDANGAVIQRIAGGPQVLVNSAVEFKGGGNVDTENQLRVMSSRSIEFRSGVGASSVLLGHGGPVYVGPTDPGGLPNGTIWVQT